MAKFPNGILGEFSGKIGTVVGASWRDINYGRSLPESSGKDATPLQEQQQTKFGFASRFVASMKGLVRITFRADAIKMSEYNFAVSYTMKNAVSGQSPEFRIHYDQVMVSRGTLPNAIMPSVSYENNWLQFHWTDNTGIGNAVAGDKAILVAYCPDLNVCEYTAGGTGRSAGVDVLDMKKYKGHAVHTWLAFISASGEAAPSVYTGEVVVE
jgi:hypothetical protein